MYIEFFVYFPLELLLYFHFVVLGSNHVNDSTALESNPIRIEIFNSVPISKDVVKSIDDESEIGLNDDLMKVSLHNESDLSKNDVEI